MNVKQMDKFTAHCDQYFGQENERVFHPVVGGRYHVDVLLYEPTEAHPYWKLVTMGASDYKMPPCKPTMGRRNEYIMLVDKDVDMSDKEEGEWYCRKLLIIAGYAHECKTHVTYGHSMEWENEDEDEGEEMVGAFLEMPQMFDFGLFHYQAGPFRKVTCLLVVLLNRSEVDRLLEIGPEKFSEELFPEDEKAPTHFLSERRRSEKF